jgi:hypothetical protein
MISPPSNQHFSPATSRRAHEFKLEGMRRVAEYAVAAASLLFLVAAAETFFPSTTRMVESRLAAAGTSLLDLLKAF